MRFYFLLLLSLAVSIQAVDWSRDAINEASLEGTETLKDLQYGHRLQEGPEFYPPDLFSDDPREKIRAKDALVRQTRMYARPVGHALGQGALALAATSLVKYLDLIPESARNKTLVKTALTAVPIVAAAHGFREALRTRRATNHFGRRAMPSVEECCARFEEGFMDGCRLAECYRRAK